MPEENKPESNPTEMAGPTRYAETARALIRKTKRATRRRFSTEDKIRIVMEGIRGRYRWRSYAAIAAITKPSATSPQQDWLLPGQRFSARLYGPFPEPCAVSAG